MNLTLKLGSQPVGAVEAFESERSDHIDGATERWRATLTLSAATPALVEQALAVLQARIGETGNAALLAGSNTVRALAVSDCRQGPRLVGVEADAPMPDSAHAPRRVRVTLEATLQDAAQAVQAHRMAVRVIRAAGAPDRILTRGVAILRAGESPAIHEGLIAPTSAGFRRLRSAITRDASAPSLEYETEDEQVFAPFPAGVDDGHVIRALETLPDGRRVNVISGFFASPGALARATELQPAALLSGRVQENPFARRADFEYRELAAPALSTGVAYKTETVSYVTARRVVDHPLLGPGLPAYRQQVGAAFTEIVQEGSAIGEGRHVAPPSPLYPADLVERRVEYSFPDVDLPPDRRFVTHWRFLMRSRGELPATSPEA